METSVNVLKVGDGGSRPPPRERQGGTRQGAMVPGYGGGSMPAQATGRLWPPRCAVVLWLPGQFVVL